MLVLTGRYYFGYSDEPEKEVVLGFSIPMANAGTLYEQRIKGKS